MKRCNSHASVKTTIIVTIGKCSTKLRRSQTFTFPKHGTGLEISLILTKDVVIAAQRDSQQRPKLPVNTSVEMLLQICQTSNKGITLLFTPEPHYYFTARHHLENHCFNRPHTRLRIIFIETQLPMCVVFFPNT